MSPLPNPNLNPSNSAVDQRASLKQPIMTESSDSSPTRSITTASGSGSSKPIFRFSETRGGAFCYNVGCIILPILIILGVLHWLLGYFWFQDIESDSDNTYYNKCLILSLLFVFGSELIICFFAIFANNIMTVCIFVPLYSTLLSCITSNINFDYPHPGLGTLLYLLMIVTVPMLYLFFLEIITVCPKSWGCLRGIQEGLEGVIVFWESLAIFKEKIKPSKVSKKQNKPEEVTNNKPVTNIEDINLNEGHHTKDQNVNDDCESLSSLSEDVALDIGTVGTSEASPGIETQGPKKSFQSYPTNILLHRVQLAYQNRNCLSKFFFKLWRFYCYLREAMLVPIVILPFIVEPYLKRYLELKPLSKEAQDRQKKYSTRNSNLKKKRSNDKTVTTPHYTLIIHGSGANTGQWILGRLSRTIQGEGDYTLWPNYLLGFAHTGPDGGVNKLGDKIFQQIMEVFGRIETGGTSENSNSSSPTPIEISVFGHSLGGDLTIEWIRRIGLGNSKSQQKSPQQIQIMEYDIDKSYSEYQPAQRESQMDSDADDNKITSSDGLILKPRRVSASYEDLLEENHHSMNAITADNERTRATVTSHNQNQIPRKDSHQFRPIHTSSNPDSKSNNDNHIHKSNDLFHPFHTNRLKFRHIITLSGPFQGARILEWAIETLPKCFLNLFGLLEQPNIDFTPGKERPMELTRVIQREIVGWSEFTDSEISDDTLSHSIVNMKTFTMINGGTDFIVQPKSGLCVYQNNKLKDQKSETKFTLSPRPYPREFEYMEGVGHYSCVAVGTFWKEIKRMLER